MEWNRIAKLKLYKVERSEYLSLIFLQATNKSKPQLKKILLVCFGSFIIPLIVNDFILVHRLRQIKIHTEFICELHFLKRGKKGLKSSFFFFF